MRLVRDDHDGAASPWDAAGRERPVFLDEAGRRHRLLRPLGLLAVLGAALWVVGLGVGATGFAGLTPLHVVVAGREPLHLVAPQRRHAAAGHPRTRLIAERGTRLLRPDGRTSRPGAPPTADRS